MDESSAWICAPGAKLPAEIRLAGTVAARIGNLVTLPARDCLLFIYKLADGGARLRRAEHTERATNNVMVPAREDARPTVS